MKKKLLLKSLQALENSTNKSFHSGDVHDWAGYAQTMRSAIDAIAPIIETIAESLDDKD